MESQNNHQLELFSQSQGGSRSKRAQGKPFLSAIRGYEKILLLIICFFVTAVISYSIGVEKGKRVSVAKSVSVQQVPAVVQEPAPKVTVPVPVTQTEQEPIIVPAGSKEIVKHGGYTIQLASYKTKASADKEAQLLKKKGYSPLVLSKGDYVVLCVGNFTTKETAKPMLAQLGKRYKGCYLRRL
jgi:cell division septation protein DedD